jgi:GNAT superfamily N-acetyltransferase
MSGRNVRVEVQQVDYEAIASMRSLYRNEADCQIVRDSILARGLANPYLILVDGRVAGYAGVWNRYFKNRVMEFHTLADRRAEASVMFRELLITSGATHIEAQTNMPLMHEMLNDFATDLTPEKLLFKENAATNLTCDGVRLRERRDRDAGPEGDWVVKRAGEVIGAGGVMFHYNPPFGDIYMEVIASARRQGVGSFLVQELRRICLRSGATPAARCDPNNRVSRKALERGGLALCGRLVTGTVDGGVLDGRSPTISTT